MGTCASSSPVQVGATFEVGRSTLRLAPATAADHFPIFDLLQNVFRAPTAGDFQVQLEDPFYEPNQRLVVRDGAQIVSHVRICPREMHFGSTTLPVATLVELATAARWRRQGLASALLAEAERQMIEDGAVVGLVRTDAPDFFLKRGWSWGGAHSWSEAGAREILAQLSAAKQAAPAASLDPTEPPAKPAALSTRIWRHVELSALERLYAAQVRNAYGPLVRSREYWSWLISRRAFDAIYVAVQGRDRRELDDRPIAAYAVVRGSRIVELCGSTACPAATTELLGRICGEAIERDVHDVVLDLAPDHPLHSLVAAAGGTVHRRELAGGQALLAKVFAPWTLLERCLPELARRAQAARLPMPVELTIQEGDRRRRIIITRRSARLDPVRTARQHLICSPGALTELLLGRSSVPEAVQRGRLRSASPGALARADVLFPRLPLWRPSLEEMIA